MIHSHYRQRLKTINKYDLTIQLGGKISKVTLHEFEVKNPERDPVAVIVRGPLEWDAGTPSLIVIAGSDRALELAKLAGYPVADTEEKWEQYQRTI